MLKSKASLVILAFVLKLAVALSTFAQGDDTSDDLTYVLAIALVKVDEPLKGQLEVRFSGGVPKPYTEAEDDPDPKYSGFSVRVPAGDDWLVQTVTIKDTPKERAGDVSWLKPKHVRRASRRVTKTRLVILEWEDLGARVENSEATVREKLDTETHRIIISFRQANFPAVTVNQPPKEGTKKVFTAAKGKTDADVYLSGAATSARNSKPLYSIESKFQYLQSLRRYGAIGGKATFVSDEGSDVDPDSITAAGSYEKVFVFGLGTGIILNSDFLGGEFDKEDKTRNLTTGLDGTLVLPSARFTDTFFGAMEFLAGFEGGKNFKNEMDTDGIGGFWRWKFGANAYLLALRPPVFNRITFNTEYKVRLPRSSEPFTEKVNGQEMTFMTKKPRHYVGSDLDLLFSPAYGLSLKYRYGSLPPAFKLVDHKVSVGFTLKLKQANK